MVGLLSTLNNGVEVLESNLILSLMMYKMYVQRVYDYF